MAIGLSLTPSIANAVTIESSTVTLIEVKKYTTIDEKIEKYAHQYNVSSQLMRDVVMCESGMNPNALGDQGHSRGLVQIHDYYNPTISHEQAYDPDFALEFLAKGISSGQGGRWTCYRQLTQV